jgi:hypothetical protein
MAGFIRFLLFWGATLLWTIRRALSFRNQAWTVKKPAWRIEKKSPGDIAEASGDARNGYLNGYTPLVNLSVMNPLSWQVVQSSPFTLSM